MSSIIVNSDEVNKVADELDRGNKDLKKELDKTSEIMLNLQKSWDSSAYRESNKAFQKFYADYSESYNDIINAYIQFLRSNVSSGYVSTEKSNIDLASQYKA